MASFDKKINNSSKVDWSILICGSMVLYHDKDVLRDDVKWLKEAEYQVVSFDFNEIETYEEFHINVKKKLNFPSYYGENISALSDCLLYDLTIPENSGLVLIFENFDAFYDNKETYAHEILECLDRNARRLLLYGERLMILIQLNNTDLIIEEVGSYIIMLNTEEFHRKAFQKKHV